MKGIYKFTNNITKKSYIGQSILPVYKKREKKWYLNGTCIDYPYNEE